MALLGITGAPDGSVLHRLGAHEEFTLYAAVTFANARGTPSQTFIELAKRVHGWGRIHCVERLQRHHRPRRRTLDLTEGFRNSIMNEYLAFIAATTGDLADALADPAPDAEVLTAASEIIDALIMGGPTEDIDDRGRTYRPCPMAPPRQASRRFARRLPHHPRHRRLLRARRLGRTSRPGYLGRQPTGRDPIYC